MRRFLPSIAVVVIVALTASISRGGWYYKTATAGGGAAALRSMSSTTYTTRTNTTITAPAGIQNGDILILAFLVGGASPPTATLPAGFAVLQGPSEATDGSFIARRQLAWKVASSESGNYTVTHTSSASQGVMLCVSGASGSTPVSSNNAWTGTGTGDLIIATGVTTPSNNSLVAYIVHNWELWGAGTAPTGSTPTFTEQLDSATSLFYVATGVLATAGATGDKTNSATQPDSSAWAAFLVTVGP